MVYALAGRVHVLLESGVLLLVAVFIYFTAKLLVGFHGKICIFHALTLPLVARADGSQLWVESEFP